MNKITQLIIMVLIFAIIAGCNNNKNAGKLIHPAAVEHQKEEGKHTEDTVVTISEESKKAMGLELETVTYRAMEEALAVTGEIAKDTENIFHVTPKSAGEVVSVDVKYYDPVQKGDVLGVIKTSKSTDEIISPQSGIVTAINANRGQYIDEITSLFTISDLSTINANFDLYEKDAGKVKVGQKIKVKSMAYPDKTFTGKIVFVSPRVDEKSRTIKVRAEINNSGHMLKFSMFVTGNIIISAGQFLAVPLKAVQKVEDKEIVFVSNGNDKYNACEIKRGFEADNYLSVLTGLKQGSRIAVDGSFLLKSELLKAEMGEGCAE